MPMHGALSGLRAAAASGADERLMRNGTAVPLAQAALPADAKDGESLLLSDESGSLVGIYTVKAGENCLRPLVVLL